MEPVQDPPGITHPAADSVIGGAVSAAPVENTPMGGMPRAIDDHDSPWKHALDIFFESAIELLAPDLHQAVDWAVSPQFLDKELQTVAAHGSHGGDRLYADKLAQVRAIDGALAWILVHVEVQGGRYGQRARQRFAHRMYRYRTRIEDHHAWLSAEASRAPPALYSMGILVESRGGPATLEYRREFLGCGICFSFPVVHLSQWLNRWDELESQATDNPFAVVVMAQLQALRHRDKTQRLGPAISLVRQLYGYGYRREQVQQLPRLIEWMLRLPAALEDDYLAAMARIEQERKMTYVTIAERHGVKKGMDDGMRIGHANLLLRQIERRFGSMPDAVIERIRSASAAQLETWALNVLDAAALEDVFRD